MVKQTVQKIMVVPPAEDQPPLFPPEFISLMVEKGYDTLRAYLEREQANPEAIKLLDDMVLLCSWKKLYGAGNVTYIENQGLAESLGSLSHSILKLGGWPMLLM